MSFRHLNVGEIETGVIAIASAVSALIIYKQARYMRRQTKILKAQTKKTNEIIEIEQKRDTQAYKISGWLVISKDHGDTGMAFGGRTPSSAQIFNGSNQPIYEVTGRIWNMSVSYENGTYREVQTFDLGTVPPGDQVEISIENAYLQEQSANYRELFGEHFADFSAWFMKPLEISFTFRDSEEVWWERTVDSRMKKI